MTKNHGTLEQFEQLVRNRISELSGERSVDSCYNIKASFENDVNVLVNLLSDKYCDEDGYVTRDSYDSVYKYLGKNYSENIRDAVIDNLVTEFGLPADYSSEDTEEWINSTADQEDIEASVNIEEQINLPGYAVEWVSGYAGSGVNHTSVKYFRTEKEQEEFADKLNSRHAVGVKTWKINNFYHTVPKSVEDQEDIEGASVSSASNQDLIKKYNLPDYQASRNLDSLQTRIFQFLDDCQGYSDYNQKIEDVSEEFGMSPDEAEGYVWDWALNHDAEWHDTVDQEEVESSVNIDATTDSPKIPSPYDQYFVIEDVDIGDSDFQPGQAIPGYDCKFIAYLMPRLDHPELESVWPILVDDPDYPVCELVGNRLYPVEVISS